MPPGYVGEGKVSVREATASKVVVTGRKVVVVVVVVATRSRLLAAWEGEKEKLFPLSLPRPLLLSLFFLSPSSSSLPLSNTRNEKTNKFGNITCHTCHTCPEITEGGYEMSFAIFDKRK